jgi:hypothetical protein
MKKSVSPGGAMAPRLAQTEAMLRLPQTSPTVSALTLPEKGQRAEDLLPQRNGHGTGSRRQRCRNAVPARRCRNHPEKRGPPLHPSSRRKPGSIVEQRDVAEWIPAFAGMTIREADAISISMTVRGGALEPLFLRERAGGGVFAEFP